MGDEQLNERLKKIILTMIQDIRDPVQTHEMLTKSPKEGGVGMEHGKTDELILILNQRVKQIHEMVEKGVKLITRKEFNHWEEKKAKLEKEDEEDKKANRDFLKKFATQKSAMPAKEEAAPIGPKKMKPSEELAPPPPVIAKKEPASEKNTPKPSLMPKQEPEEDEDDERLQIRRPKIQTPGKPIVNDIQIPSKAVGGVQEFRLLDLKNFRRIGVNANDCLEKMKQKIEELTSENYAKKIEAVKAYYKSPLYIQYSEIAKNVISKGKPVKEVIKEIQEQGKPVMTAEEFNKLSDFNEFVRT